MNLSYYSRLIFIVITVSVYSSYFGASSVDLFGFEIDLEGLFETFGLLSTLFGGAIFL